VPGAVTEVKRRIPVFLVKRSGVVEWVEPDALLPSQLAQRRVHILTAQIAEIGTEVRQANPAARGLGPGGVGGADPILHLSNRQSRRERRRRVRRLRRWLKKFAEADPAPVKAGLQMFTPPTAEVSAGKFPQVTIGDW
jgi:hypothetical protein